MNNPLDIFTKEELEQFEEWVKEHEIIKKRNERTDGDNDL